MIIFTELSDLAFSIKHEIKNDINTLPFQLRDIVSCKCAPQYKFIVVNFLTNDLVICKDDESTDLYIFDVEDVKKVGFKNVTMEPFSLHYTHFKDSYNKKNVVVLKNFCESGEFLVHFNSVGESSLEEDKELMKIFERKFK